MNNMNNGYRGGEMFTTEFDINETPPSARTLLTKGYVQDEINGYSGATVSTRGRFMTEQEKARCPHERPLYLFIQGHSKHNVDLAVQKINDIIKTEHRSYLTRPSRFTNAPPPLMSLYSGTPTVEKICIGIENPPQGFDLRDRIVGHNGANLMYIRGETGANATLRGRGSQFIEPLLGTESAEPLHLHIEHPNPSVLQNAKQLAVNLIQTMQSELQSYIQQQPPPVQSHQIIQQPIQQIQQAQYQTMNIGTLEQPNVLTIQHQDIIQHPQSSVVTLPATILTATVAGTPGSGPQSSGSLQPQDQSQEIQAFVPSSSVSQVQLIGPPPQVQYQIHSAQPLHIQGMPPSGSQASAEPITQMYVMSQPPPPPQQTFLTSGSAINGAVSYVYTQSNVQSPSTPPQNIIETVNVNLQQPPPSGPINANQQQQQPPPSLLHLHFPPPFPPNQPPPPISQTYQIQYQQLQTSTAPQSQTQFVIQHSEQHAPQQLQQNHEPPPPPPQGFAQHITQFESQPPSQLQIHGPPPPPPAQTYMLSSNSPHHTQRPPPLPNVEETQHIQEDHGLAPQPVPPPQMVPPPSINQMQHSMNIITSVPPPNHPPPQAAPWLYQGQPVPQHLQGQMQIPPPNVSLHAVPPPEPQPQIQYHTQQLQFQNGQMQYSRLPPQQSAPFDQNSESEFNKAQNLKRRYSDIESSPEIVVHQITRPTTQRPGTGEGEQQQQMMCGISGINASLPPNEFNKTIMPPSYPGEQRSGEKHFGEESKNGNTGSNAEFPPNHPQAPWQGQFRRFIQSRPLLPRGAQQQNFSFRAPPPPPPTNLPPPQIRGQLSGRAPNQGQMSKNSVRFEPIQTLNRPRKPNFQGKRGQRYQNPGFKNSGPQWKN